MIKIFVKDAKNKTHDLDVQTDDTLLEVKHKLCKQMFDQVSDSELEAFSKNVRLEQGIKVLNDRFSVSKNQIKQHDTLYMKGKLWGGVDNISITVQSFEGDLHHFTLPTSTTISGLKLLINGQAGTSSEEYILKFKGRTLIDTFTVDHFDIEDGNTIEMLPPLEEIQIEIKTFEGGKYVLEITWDKTLAQLKRMIYDKSGIKPEGQILSYLGKTIGEKSKDGSDSGKDEVILEECGFDDDCTVLVLKRLHGGYK